MMAEDEFERLARALRDAPPPATDAREAALALAMQAFDRHEARKSPDPARDSKDAARHTLASPEKPGRLSGVLTMLKSLSPARILAASTSVAALAVAIIVVAPSLRNRPVAPEATQAPEAVTPAEAAAPLAAAPAAREAADPGAAHSALSGEAMSGETLPEADTAPADVAIADTAAPSPRAKTAPIPAPVPRFAATTAETRAPQAGGEQAEGSLPPNLSGRQELIYRGANIDAFLDPFSDGLATALATTGLPAPDTNERFASAATSPIRATQAEPVSTFSIDVDTASYAIVRQFLTAGQRPPAAAVRIEEMLNYFPYSYPAPAETGNTPFRPDIAVMPTPWNPGTRLVRIGLQGRMPALADRPPLNLVFLIDTSGSMDAPNKLPLLTQALRLILPQLDPRDQVAIVAYAGAAGVVLEPTPATNDKAITQALDRLKPGGQTAGGAGLALAYDMAARMSAPGEVNRILLATDGDFNVGLSDPAALTEFVAARRDQGSYLSVLGFGRSNLDDAIMQALAQNGNGIAAYIDTAQEARKVLVDQLSGALFPLADDVKIQVEWNPAEVAEYRLIGYETRALRREDFSNDHIDAGEVGAGLQVTALYEITAPDSPALRHEPLRYGSAPQPAPGKGELGYLRLRYKHPDSAQSALTETPILASDQVPGEDTRFAAAIAGFGQLLTGGAYLGTWGWSDAIALAEGARGRDPFGYRIEAVNLMRLAQAMAAQ